MDEIIELIKDGLKDNWRLTIFAVIVFCSIFFIYPHTDMGKQAENEKRNNVIMLYQHGALTENEKQEAMEKLGMTEDEFNPLRAYVEENR